MLEVPSRKAKINLELPTIPSKRYFTIGEVSEHCAVKPHELRNWDQEFPQLKPAKRRGNRRYYQQHDVQMIRTIRGLLYEQGFTIGGARLKLSGSVEKTAPVVEKRTDAELVSDLCQELEDLLVTLEV